MEPSHYFRAAYDSKERFISYWHQICEIVKLNPASILEIGIGNKFVSNYLKNKSYKVTTFDFDINLKPDLCGSVLNLPFKNESFELSACCEVLEHIPFDLFTSALAEIYRVTKYHVVISLPDVGRVFPLLIKLPKVGVIKKLIPLPKIPKIHNFDDEHYWEINKKNYPLKKIVSEIQSANFTILQTFQIFEFPYHRFFILKK